MGGYPSTNIPPLAQQLLPQLKSALRESILQSLNSHNVLDPVILHDLILADLRTQGAALPDSGQNFADNANFERFGSLEDVQVQQPTRHPDLLAVVIRLGIPCGSDSSLNIYRRLGARWELLMVKESNDYTDVSGGQGSFEFAVSPPDEDGNWFVVTANVNPWCSSNWQMLRYQVLRPPSGPGDQPLEILTEKTGIYMGNDKLYTLTIQKNGFAITNEDSQSLDSGILIRTHIHKYRVEANSVTRIPPLALAPEDFLDEWIGLKWEEASRWVLSSDISGVQEWQVLLHRGEEGGREFYTEFDFVQPCPASGHDLRWQIGLNLEGSGEAQLPEDLPDELFITVVKQGAAYYLESLTTHRAPGCPGNAQAQGARDLLR